MVLLYGSLAHRCCKPSQDCRSGSSQRWLLEPPCFVFYWARKKQHIKLPQFSDIGTTYNCWVCVFFQLIGFRLNFQYTHGWWSNPYVRTLNAPFFERNKYSITLGWLGDSLMSQLSHGSSTSTVVFQNSDIYIYTYVFIVIYYYY
jgi:hypothetical protein